MRLRQFVKAALYRSGYYAHRLARHPYPGVAVLAYHGLRDDEWRSGTMPFENLHVTASRFAAHCECLRALGCSPLSLVDWMEVAQRVKPLPARPVLLTFDDGYRSVLKYALPILERFQIPAVVFACSDPIEHGTRFWFDAVASRVGEDAVERAKSSDYDTWRELIVEQEMPATVDDPCAPLTVEELKRLAHHPLISIGAHTGSHPILARAPGSVQQEEMLRCRRALERWTDRPVTAFAYPNGRPAVDYTSETVRIVADSGFACAFTTADGFADPSLDPFEQSRFMMLDSVSGPELAHRLAMSWPRHVLGAGPAAASRVECRVA